MKLNAKDGRTPLYAACERGNEAIASRLIRLGVKVDAKRTDGSTALIAAVCSPAPQTPLHPVCCLRRRARATAPPGGPYVSYLAERRL